MGGLGYVEAGRKDLPNRYVVRSGRVLEAEVAARREAVARVKGLF